MTALWALIPNWLKVALAALAVAALIAGGSYLAGKLSGKASTETKIERQNNEATGKALDAARSYDECIDAGGVWTFRTGKCERRS
ncbi:hypothetical protein [Brucella lupini]|uniref:Uncharacterized protein n=1 Tax=Brucella lupini TaxID=255457 RepID=A0A256GHC8_9HYPH|nr:hypothetical protein [Brucella lupini]KAB2701304.1 hypothetical protein F9L03_23940 [Brucella lupini]OYR26296.1 hypothetical protein CES86_3764 [Brucella lupini]